MDVSLGPWKGLMSVDEKLRQPLADAMGHTAWKTVEGTAGFTPKEGPKDKPASSGFAISGKVTNTIKEGGKTRVMATFEVWFDGTFPNIKSVNGEAYSEGSMTAKDAIEAITEGKIAQILGLVKAGTLKKAV